MRNFIQKIKLVFIDPESAIESPISTSENIIISIIITFITLLFLIKNPLSPDVLSISLFPIPDGINLYAKTVISIIIQFFVISVPYFIILGKTGVRFWLNNIALIQFINLIIILIGFIFESVFWPLYKMLPISGLTSQSIFDAIFLLYPLLILIIFRYIILWIVAIKAGASTSKIVLIVIIHSILCIGVWLMVGVL